MHTVTDWPRMKKSVFDANFATPTYAYSSSPRRVIRYYFFHFKSRSAHRSHLFFFFLLIFPNSSTGPIISTRLCRRIRRARARTVLRKTTLVRAFIYLPRENPSVTDDVLSIMRIANIGSTRYNILLAVGILCNSHGSFPVQPPLSYPHGPQTVYIMHGRTYILYAQEISQRGPRWQVSCVSRGRYRRETHAVASLRAVVAVKY